MRLTKKIFLSSFATSINILSGFLRNKIIAVYLSVSLFGILAISQQSVSLVFTIFAFGLPAGIGVFGAKLSTLPDKEQKKAISKLLMLLITLSLVLLILLLLVYIFYSGELTYAIAGNKEYVFPIFIVLAAAPFMIIQNSLTSLMEGMGLVKQLSYFKIIPSLIVIPALFFAVVKYQLLGAAFGTLLTEVVFTVFALSVFYKYIAISKESFHFGEVVNEVLKVAAASAVVGAIWMLTDFILKRYLLEAFGKVDNGIVQSVSKIIDLYPTLVLAWLNLHLFPVLASSSGDKKKVIAHLERTVLIAATLIIPIVISLFIFRPLVLHILYQKGFVIAENYFGSMLVSGIPKVITWVIGVALLPLGLKKEWFLSSLVYIVAYVILSFVGLNFGLGIQIIPFATVLALLIQFIAILFLLQKNNYRFTSNFLHQSLLYASITFFIFVAKFQIFFLILAGLLYFYLIYRQNLISELYFRVKNVIKKNIT